MAQDGSRLSRKEAIREYKERKTPRGIYAARCVATEQTWVESSPNLASARNGLWFTLRLGNHPNRKLQEVWNEQGESAFTWEILEELEDDIAQLNLAGALKQRKQEWIERLSAVPIF